MIDLLTEPPPLLMEECPFRPWGAARDLQTAWEDEILIEGPAGVGKSRAVLEKVDSAAHLFPGMRALLIRKTRESMTDSVLIEFEKHVVSANNAEMLRGIQRRMRQSYCYENGSEVVAVGLDNSAKIMSTEYDMACFFEATEIQENDYERVTTRLRNNVMPFQQAICDCNPDAPSHWLNRRANEGRMRRLLSRHQDNPRWYDHKANSWTRDGLKYLAKLDALTGARKQRLRHGRWVAAEGAVYEGWDASLHVIAKPHNAIRWHFAGVDWGWTNPGVIAVFGVDGDGRIYCVHQVYQSQRDLDWWSAKARELQARYDTRVFVCDPAEPGNIAKLRKEGIRCMEADNDIFPGLRSVENRLAKAKDGLPRLFFIKGNLESRDAMLSEQNLPCRGEEEMDVYIYPPNVKGDKNNKEVPLDKNQHCLDVTRYCSVYADRFGVVRVCKVNHTGEEE